MEEYLCCWQKQWKGYMANFGSQLFSSYSARPMNLLLGLVHTVRFLLVATAILLIINMCCTGINGSVRTMWLRQRYRLLSSPLQVNGNCKLQSQSEKNGQCEWAITVESSLFTSSCFLVDFNALEASKLSVQTYYMWKFEMTSEGVRDKTPEKNSETLEILIYIYLHILEPTNFNSFKLDLFSVCQYWQHC